MRYSKIPVMKNQTYYILVVFKDKNKSGKTISNEYKKESNAVKKFKELIKSGLYERVMIRKEDIVSRYDGVCEISISSPYKKWEAA